VEAALDDLHRYPSQGPLAGQIAEACGVEARQVLVGNGSDELCYVLAALFLDDRARVVLSRPTFRVEEIASLLRGAALVAVDLDAGRHDVDALAAAVRSHGARMLWLPTPHNPTGAAVRPDELRRLLGAVPSSCVVVLDEAYRSFVEPELLVDADELLERPNVVLLRTFSKDHGLAGLRLGYLLADRRLVDALHAVRAPFNVNRLALVAGAAALSDEAWRRRTVGEVRASRRHLQHRLGTAGIPFVASQANFVAVKVGDPDVVHAALAARGLIVRDGAGLGLPGWVRATIGTTPVTRLLAEVLAQTAVVRPARPL
jgi:histidinol-phosphate aminotransferase